MGFSPWISDTEYKSAFLAVAVVVVGLLMTWVTYSSNTQRVTTIAWAKPSPDLGTKRTQSDKANYRANKGKEMRVANDSKAERRCFVGTRDFLHPTAPLIHANHPTPFHFPLL